MTSKVLTLIVLNEAELILTKLIGAAMKEALPFKGLAEMDVRIPNHARLNLRDANTLVDQVLIESTSH